MMHLLQARVNLVYIIDFLGHTAVSTNEIIARADSKFKREALEKAFISISKIDNKGNAMWFMHKDVIRQLDQQNRKRIGYQRKVEQ